MFSPGRANSYLLRVGYSLAFERYGELRGRRLGHFSSASILSWTALVAERATVGAQAPDVATPTEVRGRLQEMSRLETAIFHVVGYAV
jgi:hypothetical protein